MYVFNTDIITYLADLKLLYSLNELLIGLNPKQITIDFFLRR